MKGSQSTMRFGIRFYRLGSRVSGFGNGPCGPCASPKCKLRGRRPCPPRPGFRLRISVLGFLNFGFRVWGISFQVSGFRCFLFSGSGFRVSGAGCRVSSCGLRVSNFKFRVLGFGFRISGLGFRVSGFEFRVSGFVFQLLGSEFRVLGSGFRVLAF